MILPDRINNIVGGLGLQAKYLMKHLQDDYEWSVHGFPGDIPYPGYHEVYNPLPMISHGGLNGLTCQVSYLASILSGPKPDLIHVSDYSEYLAGYYASQVLGVPLVVWMQISAHLMNQSGVWSARDPRSPDGMAIDRTYREMELFGLQKADHIMHVSLDYKKIYAKIPGLDEKSSYIPNGVDPEEWSEEREGFKKVKLPGSGRLKLISIGRITRQKNLEALLLARIPADIDLIFVGAEENASPELLKAIRLKSQTRHNIHYIGPRFGQEKVNLLAASDAVIIPSLHECHPIVMHEAMVTGNVLLTSGAGDMKEVLPRDMAMDCGVTSESITRALEQLAAMSSEEIEKRKARGREVVKEYTWEKAAQKTKEIYDRLIAKSRSKRGK